MLDWMDLIPESPFSRPCRRWDLGRWIVRHGDKVPGKYRDAGVERVVRLLTSRGVRRSVIREAKELFEVKSSARTSLLEACILTGATHKVVTERTAIAPGVVTEYSSVFFDVRGRLRHPDWIARHAIGAGLWVGFRHDEIGQILRMFAYHGGLDLLNAVLAVCVEDKLIPKADVPGLDKLPRIGDRLRESIRVAIKVAMLPRGTSFKHLAELHLHCRRQQSRPQTKNIADRALASVHDLLTHQTVDNELLATQCSGMDPRKLVACW